MCFFLLFAWKPCDGWSVPAEKVYKFMEVLQYGEGIDQGLYRQNGAGATDDVYVPRICAFCTCRRKKADFQVCLPCAEKEGFTATFLLTESRGCYDGGCRCD